MKDTWNLSDLYTSETDPQIQKDIEQSTLDIKNFVQKWKNNTEYLSNPSILKIALDEYEQLQNTPGICDKPTYYFILRNNLDQTNATIKALLNQLSEINTQLENELQFFELAISKISKEKQDTFLEDPDLGQYKHFLEQLFLSAKYLLSEKEENVFNLTSKTSYSNWANMLSELLDKQQLKVLNEESKEEVITYNEISKYLDSQDKMVRDYAASEFNKINNRYSEIAEFEINSILESKRNSDKYRNIPKPELPRHIADDIESDIVDTMVKVVSDNFDISRKYYTRKAEILGLKTLAYHERNIPLKGADLQYSYEDSINIVKRVFNNLDTQFGDIISNFEISGKYDIYPQKGKTGGAFCISLSKSLPTYILLNHQNQLNDVLTIAHESGHGIHAELSRKQNALNCDPPISLAEIASTFFEDFVLQEILKNTDSEEIRKAIIDMKLHTDISTIFRQVAFYNFEKELHQEFRKHGFLTKEYISEIFCKHMKSYLGDSVSVDDGMRNGWIYVSHFRNPFYVYSYASGLLISKTLQSLVKQDVQNIKYVKQFMESGSSKSPKILFGDMGLDITKEQFWQTGIKDVEELLSKL